MISRSDWEPLPKPTLSPFVRGYLSLCRFFTAAVWCVPALRVPLVHSLINHFRQKNGSAVLAVRGDTCSARARSRSLLVGSGPGCSARWRSLLAESRRGARPRSPPVDSELQLQPQRNATVARTPWVG